MFIKLVNMAAVNNLSKLKMKVSIAKHVEFSDIYFDFSDNIKIEDIPDDIVISLLDNIENRLQLTRGSNYLIIRRIHDNNIMLCAIRDDN